MAARLGWDRPLPALLRDLGMTYAITYFPEVAYDRSGLTLFAEKVIPDLA
jgi:hypothetical protein